MTKKRALQLIEEHQPSNLEDFNKLGFKLELIGKGGFRHTYKIKGLKMVVKFPWGQGVKDFRTAKLHTTVEVNKWRHFMKFKELRCHLPCLYYHDRKHGVAIFEYVKEMDCTAEDRYRYLTHELGVMVGKLIKIHTGKNLSDLNEDNLRLPQFGCIKFVDLAY